MNPTGASACVHCGKNLLWSASEYAEEVRARRTLRYVAVVIMLFPVLILPFLVFSGVSAFPWAFYWVGILFVCWGIGKAILRKVGRFIF